MPLLDRSPALEMTPHEVLVIVDSSGFKPPESTVSLDFVIDNERKAMHCIDKELFVRKFVWHDEEAASRLEQERLTHALIVGWRKRGLGLEASDNEQEIRKLASVRDMARKRNIDPIPPIAYWQNLIGTAVKAQVEIIEGSPSA